CPLPATTLHSDLHSSPTRRSSDLKAAYVLLAGSVDFSMRELDYFSRWIGRGNDVVIVSERFGERLLGYLNLTDSRYWHMVHDGSDRKSTRLNSSHVKISYAVFCLK